MKIAKALFRGAITRVSQTAVSIIIAFFMMPFLVDNLGDYWYGMWSVVAGITGVFHLFDFGLASAVTRYLSLALGKSDTEQANKVINTALGIYVLIAAVLCLISIFIAFSPELFISDSENLDVIKKIILIMGISVALEFPFNALAGVPQALFKFHYLAVTRIIISILSACAIYVVIDNGMGVIAIAWVSFTMARLSNLMFIVVSKLSFPELRFSTELYDKKLLNKLFSFSMWAFIIVIGRQMRSNLDSIVIASMISASAVTHYVVAQRLVEYASNFLTQATNMLTPLFTQYYAKNNQNQFKIVLLFAVKVNFFLSAIATTGISMIGYQFISMWVGGEYSDAYPVLCILLFILNILLITQPINSALMAVDKHSINAKIDAIEGPTNLLLTIYLVSVFGIKGAALGSLISVFLSRLVFLPLFGLKILNLKIWEFYKTLIVIFLAIIPWFCIWYWLGTNLFIIKSYTMLFTLLIVYGVVSAGLLMLIVFNSIEKDLIRSILPVSEKLAGLIRRK